MPNGALWARYTSYVLSYELGANTSYTHVFTRKGSYFH